MTWLRVAGLHVRIDAPPIIERAVEERFGTFLASADNADVRLHVTAAPAGFSTDFHLDRPDERLQIVAARESGAIRLGGAACGSYDPERGEGRVEEARHLGHVDALLRLALSLALPRRGTLLLHGAAVSTENGTDERRSVSVLVGRSGAGKSTAAAALGDSLCDELIAVRPDPNAASEGADAWGTPYWRGLAECRRVADLVCLERGLPSSSAPLVGGAAVRALAPHVVRYVPDGETDRASFALLGALCVAVPVRRVACPEGAGFLPYLRAALAASHVDPAATEACQ